MLSLLFMTKRKSQTLEEKVTLIQKGDNVLHNEVINTYKPFIAKTVSSVCSRYISETDDEFSIGLIAFNEAIEKFSLDRGRSLLAFSEVIIKRRVIDYIRKQSKSQLLSIDSENTFSEQDSADSILVNDLSLAEYHKKMEEQSRKEEILHFQSVLASFKVSFNDLVETSPKHTDARKNSIFVAKTLAEHRELMEILFEKKRLPINQLESLVNVSRKTIERNRKYIIATALILSSNYTYLKDYIKGVLDS